MLRSFMDGWDKRVEYVNDALWL